MAAVALQDEVRAGQGVRASGQPHDSRPEPIPSACRTSADFEHLFVSELGTIERAVAFIARRHRLNTDETEELTSLVHTRLIDDDYAVLRKFERRSTLKTYLTVVIQRVFLDYRISVWGKWRPSTQARREGATAVLLERLTGRHSLDFDQACTMLEQVQAAAVDRAALRDLYDRLPRRSRRHFVREDALTQVASCTPGADRLVTAAQRARVALRTAKLLSAALATLPPEDRLILKLRFVDGLTMGDIGRALSRHRFVEPKTLYRRVRRLLNDLRAALERHGVDRGEVLDTVGAADVTIPRALDRSAPAARERAGTTTPFDAIAAACLAPPQPGRRPVVAHQLRAGG
jgi:RNA polymerase sigma factor for flagellar operon FliA